MGKINNMKTTITLSIALLIALQLFSQSQYELVKPEIAKSGSLDQISKPLINHPIVKLDDYDSLNMSFAGNWGLGQSFSISCSPTGDTVFVGSGAGVIIFDANDPYNPVKLSEIHARALVDASSYDAANQLLYLAAYFSGLEVWDLSDIYNPQRLGRVPATGLPRGGVHFRNSAAGTPEHAYLANVVDGVDVFNVSDPQNIVKTGTYNFTGSLLVWNSYKQGDSLYIAASGGGTRAINLSASPALSSAFNIDAASTSVHVAGTLAYIVNYAYGLKIYDFSSFPPTLTGQVQQTGFPQNLTVFNNHAYVANSGNSPFGGVNIINVANPASPQYITDFEGSQAYIAGKNNTVYATGGAEGCLFLDVTDPALPVEASTYSLPNSTWDLAVAGDYVYSGSNGFRVFDVSNKNHPVQVGYHATLGDLVKVTGNLAIYCPESMGSNNKVNIMDISDPANPQKLSHYMAPVMTNDISLKGNFAFIACWWDGFRVINFDDPNAPVLAAHEMGWVNGGIPGVEWSYVQALDVDEDYLYVVDYQPFEDEDTKGVYIFDISNPANPQFVSRLPVYTGKAYDINASNGYVYLADSQGGFNVIDATNPANPYEMAYLSLGDAANALVVFGNYAFIANYINGGVQVINVASPASPFVEGYYRRTGCFAMSVDYEAGHVYIADGPAGFGIYRFDLLSGDNETSEPGSFSFQVQPNPAREQFIVSMELESSQNLSIELCDLEGRKVKSVFNGSANTGNFTMKLNTDGIRSGIYLIKVVIDGQLNSKKIVIY